MKVTNAMHQLILKDYIDECERLQLEHDKAIGRKYSTDSFSHTVREYSRYFSYILYRMNIRGHHVLILHFIYDLMACAAVYYQAPWHAASFWLFAHFLDNMDGDLARIRGEARPEWHAVDVALHTAANALFWVCYASSYGNVIAVCTVLGAETVQIYMRSLIENRHGEKSVWWHLLALPTNINVQNISYCTLAMAGLGYEFATVFAIYVCMVAVGQLVGQIKSALESVK